VPNVAAVAWQAIGPAAAAGIADSHNAGSHLRAIPCPPSFLFATALPDRRADWEPSQLYTYPEHLLPQLAGMPAAPGVYTFHAAEGAVPLYIGKSVNLRARLLSHLRNPAQARLLRQTARISHIRTAGDLGALLLEAQRIKQLQPIYNQKLRRNRQLCALRLAAGVPEVVYAKDLDFAATPDLFGLFSSRHAALQALRDLADAHQLCGGVLGLEALATGRPCFRRQLRRCVGACQGAESLHAHGERLQAALQTLRVQTWPYAGSVGLVEEGADMTQVHVVRNWLYLGSAASLAQARRLDKVAAGFDADGYRLLCGPVLGGAYPVVSL